MAGNYGLTVVAFPLRGEWLAPNTPGTKIPSHGTNKFGTRYAYDFVQVYWNKKGKLAYKGSFFKYLLCGIAIEDYLCWGEVVYSPCDGIVVQVSDGYDERKKTNLLSDTVNAYKNAHKFDPEVDDVRTVSGNYVLIKIEDACYAALCHLQKDSIQVTVGQVVNAGDRIGRIGHSGNSFAPHLHFQLMDCPEIQSANGLPCAFASYEVYQDGDWQTVKNGIPTNKQRIRFIN